MWFVCRFNLYEPVEFISRHLMDKLEWTKVKDNVAIHVPCSSKKMGIEAAFNNVASKCAHSVTPSDVPCCGKASQQLCTWCVVAAVRDCSGCVTLHDM